VLLLLSVACLFVKLVVTDCVSSAGLQPVSLSNVHGVAWRMRFAVRVVQFAVQLLSTSLSGCIAF